MGLSGWGLEPPRDVLNQENEELSAQRLCKKVVNNFLITICLLDLTGRRPEGFSTFSGEGLISGRM